MTKDDLIMSDEFVNTLLVKVSISSSFEDKVESLPSFMASEKFVKDEALIGLIPTKVDLITDEFVNTVLAKDFVSFNSSKNEISVRFLFTVVVVVVFVVVVVVVIIDKDFLWISIDVVAVER